MPKGHVLYSDTNGDIIDGNGNIIPATNLAGISFDKNVSELVIGLVNSFYLITDWDTDGPGVVSNPDNTTNNITIGATGKYNVHLKIGGESAGANKLYQWYVFELSPTTVITGATQADPVVITAAGHGFTGGEQVAIKSVVGMVEINDRICTVADVSGATFELTDDGGASPANDIDGTGFTAYTSGGTVQLATPTRVHIHRRFPLNDYGDMSDLFPVPLTLDNTLEVYVKGDTDTTNFTHEHMNLSFNRIN